MTAMIKSIRRKANSTTTDVYICGSFTAAVFFYIGYKKMLIKVQGQCIIKWNGQAVKPPIFKKGSEENEVDNK